MSAKTTLEEIGFEKYLSCPKCQEEELYCTEHRAEVESILFS